MVRTVAVGLLVSAIGLASAQAAPPPPRKIRAGTPCELALALLTQGGGDSLLISDRRLQERKYDPTPPMQTSRFPEDLRRAWNNQKPSNFLEACPKEAAEIPGLRIATEDDWEKQRHLGPGPTITYMGAPIVDRTGRHVLLSSGYSCPGLCAGGFVNHWEKVGHVWIDRGFLEMMFS